MFGWPRALPLVTRILTQPRLKSDLLQTNEMTAFLFRIDRQTGKRGAEKDWALRGLLSNSG